VTTGRQVPFSMFTDPELARVGLSETQAASLGMSYRLFKIPWLPFCERERCPRRAAS